MTEDDIVYCGMCGKKMNPGDYWFIHYWGDYEGQEVRTYLCSMNCVMENKKLQFELELKERRSY